MAKLIDSYCHIDGEAFDADRDQVGCCLDIGSRSFKPKWNESGI